MGNAAMQDEVATPSLSAWAAACAFWMATPRYQRDLLEDGVGAGLDAAIVVAGLEGRDHGVADDDAPDMASVSVPSRP